MLTISTLVASASACSGQFEDGLAAREKGDYARAVNTFQPLAQSGDANTNLGNAFNMGREVPQDTIKAYAWLSIVDFLDDGQSLAKRPLKYAMIAPDSTSH